eukprot:CAMPEP_0196598836 /NCGR_PEP_ID=MMETSP1081-20130531/94535_1 /TAXON_ID=36882 /ORGANISM="Pyramimonas amylifera, Strain CCMP720" /LENGTH=168 /DNA_ID=CAMNT_0041924563 /DNA_START=169 /DNA_END=675 /DNA_ORIENTATION=+
MLNKTEVEVDVDRKNRLITNEIDEEPLISFNPFEANEPVSEIFHIKRSLKLQVESDDDVEEFPLSTKVVATCGPNIRVILGALPILTFVVFMAFMHIFSLHRTQHRPYMQHLLYDSGVNLAMYDPYGDFDRMKTLSNSHHILTSPASTPCRDSGGCRSMVAQRACGAC